MQTQSYLNQAYNLIDINQHLKKLIEKKEERRSIRLNHNKKRKADRISMLDQIEVESRNNSIVLNYNRNDD